MRRPEPRPEAGVPRRSGLSLRAQVVRTLAAVAALLVALGTSSLLPAPSSSIAATSGPARPGPLDLQRPNAMPPLELTSPTVPLRGQAALRVPASGSGQRGGYPTGARYGVDVSWPQCPDPLPRIAVDLAVVGISDGRAGTVNPCLREQVAWAGQQRAALGVYVVPNSPDPATLAAAATGPCPASEPDCPFYRSGVVEAQQALSVARAASVHALTWWLDVEETDPRAMWGANHAENSAVLRGWAETLAAAGHRVGVYSTAGYWNLVTGGLLANLPEWVAVGEAGIGAAREACATPFSDGPVVMTQWWTGPIDGDLVCPGQQQLAGQLFTWLRPRTPGVDPLLTTPVPHPHPDHAKHKKHKRHAKHKKGHGKPAPKRSTKQQKTSTAAPKPAPRRAPSRSPARTGTPAPAPSKPAPSRTPTPTPVPTSPTGPSPTAPSPTAPTSTPS